MGVNGVGVVGVHICTHHWTLPRITSHTGYSRWGMNSGKGAGIMRVSRPDTSGIQQWQGRVKNGKHNPAPNPPPHKHSKTPQTLDTRTWSGKDHQVHLPHRTPPPPAPPAPQIDPHTDTDKYYLQKALTSVEASATEPGPIGRDRLLVPRTVRPSRAREEPPTETLACRPPPPAPTEGDVGVLKAAAEGMTATVAWRARAMGRDADADAAGVGGRDTVLP
jgi:hypothetical protein